MRSRPRGYKAVTKQPQSGYEAVTERLRSGYDALGLPPTRSESSFSWICIAAWEAAATSAASALADGTRSILSEMATVHGYPPTLASRGQASVHPYSAAPQTGVEYLTA